MSKKTILIAIAALLTVNVWGQTSITSLGSYVWNATDEPKTFTNKLQMSFVRSLDGFSQYGTVLAGGGFNNTGQDGGVFQLYFPYGEALGGIAPKIRLGRYDNQGWSNWETFYTSANANLATVDWAAKDLIVYSDLGIGTTSPQEKLEIKDGSLRFSNLTSVAYGSLGKIDFYNYVSDANVVSARIEGKRDSYSHKDGRLSFYTSNIDGILNEQMTIDRFGNVGVGTTSPNSKLVVEGDAIINGILYVKSNSTQLRIVDTDENNQSWSLNVNSDKFNIRDITAGTNPLRIEDGALDNTLYLTSNGNVGIGTTTPQEKLHIYNATAQQKIEIESGSTTNAGIKFTNTLGSYHIFAGGTGGLSFNDVNASITRMVIKSSGNVGIGTTAPPYKLSVEGTIGAREVIVTSDNWADFVFEENYKLISIKKLESFIEKNKHLPDVPSESEVKENGVSLGEMDKILLQKIEELTLYIIELKKENDKLNEKVNALMQE